MAGKKNIIEVVIFLWKKCIIFVGNFKKFAIYNKLIRSVFNFGNFGFNLLKEKIINTFCVHRNTSIIIVL